MVITDPAADKTTFVMPNSYCRNLDLCVDGGSQNDWYTGSGTVLYKNLYRFGFGIEPNLDGLTIQTAAYMPCKEATAQFIMKGHGVTLNYKNSGNSKREIFINGVKQPTVYDNIMKTEKLFIKNQDISDNMIITVTD
jgi:cellobiose phosphorylase